MNRGHHDRTKGYALELYIDRVVSHCSIELRHAHFKQTAAILRQEQTKKNVKSRQTT